MIGLSEIKDVVKYICKREGVLPLDNIKITDARSYVGCCHSGKQGIQLRFSRYCLKDEDIEYVYHVIIHETLHYTCKAFHNHRRNGFREKEISYCEEFGFRPTGYKRAYASRLETLSGKYICKA